MIEPPGEAGRWLGFCDHHRTKMFVFNEVTSVVSPLGDGDVSFDETNVESFSKDRDLNEQLELLDAIDSPYEDTKSGAPSVDAPLVEEPSLLSAAVTSASGIVGQTTGVTTPADVSYIYMHACIEYVSLHRRDRVLH